jgi:hypothetical protein
MTRPSRETSGWFRYKKQIKLVAEGWNELQKMSRNILSFQCDSRGIYFSASDSERRAATRSRPFIFNPLPSQCVLYSFRFRQSFPVHFKPKEKKRALFRGRSQEERRSFAGWERCIAKVIAKEREAPLPIHKNINSFAAAIRDKIYYQPAGRRGEPSWGLWEKTAPSRSLPSTESNIAGLYWSMPG